MARLRTLLVFSLLSSGLLAQSPADLLGDRVDLVVKARAALAEKGELPKSLVGGAPGWMRQVIRRATAQPAFAGFLRQLPDLLAEGRLAERVREGLAQKAWQRFLELEATWLTREEVSRLDLVVLEAGYSFLAGLRAPMDLATAVTPWPSVLAFSARREFGLSDQQLGELVEFVRLVPRRAGRLHMQVTFRLLTKDDRDPPAAWALQNLSRFFAPDDGAKAREYLRQGLLRKKERTAFDWLELADVCARSGQVDVAKRAIVIAGETERDAGSEEHYARRLAGVHRRVALGERLAVLVEAPPTAEMMAVLQGLDRPQTLARLAQRLIGAGTKDARVFANLGLAYVGSGSIEPARKLLAQAESAGGRGLATRRLRAYVAFRDATDVAARSCFKGALDPEVFQRIGKLRDAVGALAGEASLAYLGALHAVLDVLVDLGPAILAQDGSMVPALLDKIQPKLLRLRDRAGGIAAFHTAPLLALFLRGDLSTLESLLAAPKALEAKDPQLRALRARLGLFVADGRAGAVPLCERLIAASPAREQPLLRGALFVLRAMPEDAELWRRAASEFRKGLAVDGHPPDVRACLENNLGVCLAHLGDTVAAKGHFEAAVALQAKVQDQVPARAPVLAEMNRATLGTEPDIEGLRALVDRSGVGSRAAWRHLLAALREKREVDALRAAARKPPDGGPLTVGWTSVNLVPENQFYWGVRLRVGELRLVLDQTSLPWLIRPAKVADAEIEAWAKRP